ncbi:MAG TPA: FKBP-type peptidyl-prolyl cis-trans isomerase [Planctomycetota bacterium]|jgi:FKBP-type peptidyl-prolyl cis-trans isomerase
MRTVAAALCVLALGVAARAEEPSAPKTDKDKISYAIGTQMGTSIKDFADDLDLNVMLKGMQDAVAGKNAMTQAEIRTVMMAFQEKAMAKMKGAAAKAGEKNQKDGEAFLAENKKKDGVTELPSGLQYKVIKEGTGEMPKASDTVSVHYKGTVLDGTEFDSSYSRNEPASFQVGGVIPGWTEALQKMKVGSKWQLFIPGKLAYGEQGRQGSPIGPNSLLIFEVELLSIKK